MPPCGHEETLFKQTNHNNVSNSKSMSKQQPISQMTVAVQRLRTNNQRSETHNASNSPKLITLLCVCVRVCCKLICGSAAQSGPGVQLIDPNSPVSVGSFRGLTPSLLQRPLVFFLPLTPNRSLLSLFLPSSPHLEHRSALSSVGPTSSFSSQVSLIGKASPSL